jgi:hypothetical protein
MVAVVEKRVVTHEPRRLVPADMLLVEERRRRMLEHSPTDAFARIDSRASSIITDEILTPDEDQLIETEPVDERSSAIASGDVLLRRPMSHVSLVQVSWSGPIDHDALQEAVLCYPVDVHDAFAQSSVFGVPPFAPVDDGAALEVTLRPSDFALLRSLKAADARRAVAHIVRAARLPDRLTGAEQAARHAAAAVLAAYRHASLAYAWHRHLSRLESAQLHRERDEAAVAVLSTLRALLGER